MQESSRPPASLLLWLAAASVIAGAERSDSPRISLKNNWALQSSCEVKASGADISTAGFETRGWHKTNAPSTVVAALVADRTYADPYFGTNLRNFPGMKYRIGALFSNLPMPDDSPFRCSWWYRAEFTLPRDSGQKTTWLHLDGVNYRANVW